VPPLRARREDIPHLVRHFMARIAAEENRPVTAVSGEAMALLDNCPGRAMSGSSRMPSIAPWS
jgi:DNA-binding NtrC family response regulator